MLLSNLLQSNPRLELNYFSITEYCNQITFVKLVNIHLMVGNINVILGSFHQSTEYCHLFVHFLHKTGRSQVLKIHTKPYKLLTAMFPKQYSAQ